MSVEYIHPLGRVLEQESLHLEGPDSNPPNQFPSFLGNRMVQWQMDVGENNPLGFHVGSMLNQSTYQSPNTMSLGCKDIRDFRSKLNGGQINNRYIFNCVPQLGNQRGDPLGLVYVPTHNPYNPLLDPPNSFYSGLHNPLSPPEYSL